MLVLERRVGESIMIGDDIDVRVLKVDGKRVRLGFDCPADISVVRHELGEQQSGNHRAIRGARYDRRTAQDHPWS